MGVAEEFPGTEKNVDVESENIENETLIVYSLLDENGMT